MTSNNEETIIKDDGETFIKVFKLKAPHKFFDKKAVTSDFLKQLKGTPSKRKGVWSSSDTSRTTDSPFLRKLREFDNTEPSEEQATSFNTGNWDVFHNGKWVGTIPLGTRGHHFFECLYKNFGNAVYHTDITAYFSQLKNASRDDRLKWKTEATSFCAEVKSRLPKPIGDLIQAWKKYYILTDNKIR